MIYLHPVVAVPNKWRFRYPSSEFYCDGVGVRVYVRVEKEVVT